MLPAPAFGAKQFAVHCFQLFHVEESRMPETINEKFNFFSEKMLFL